MASSRRRGRPSFRIVQPVALFLLGAGAFVYEVVVADSDRPLLLAMIAAMLGFPLARVVDVLRNPYSATEDELEEEIGRRKELERQLAEERRLRSQEQPPP